MKGIIKFISMIFFGLTLQACGPGFSATESTGNLNFVDLASTPSNFEVNSASDGSDEQAPSSSQLLSYEDQVYALFSEHLNKEPTDEQLDTFVGLLRDGEIIEAIIQDMAAADQANETESRPVPTADNGPAPAPPQASQPSQPSAPAPSVDRGPSGQMYAIAIRYNGSRKMASGTRGGSPISRYKAEIECGQLIKNGNTNRKGNGNLENPDFPDRAEQYICVHAGEVIEYKGRVLRNLFTQSINSLLPDLKSALCERETHWSCN